MRSTKFRGKDIETKECVYGSYVNTTLLPYIITGTCISGNIHLVDPETVCQYIEKNDQTGNEIYENDMVEIIVNTRIGERHAGSGRNKKTFAIYGDISQTGIVKWNSDKSKYYIELISGIPEYETCFYQMKASDPTRLEKGFKTVDIGEWKEIRVVGNIYTTPELPTDLRGE